jgi:hypothetical protein
MLEKVHVSKIFARGAPDVLKIYHVNIQNEPAA